MRFPYLGAARVKYLISMAEHRRQLRRVRGWAAASAAGKVEDPVIANTAEAINEPLPKRARLDTAEAS